LPQDYNANSNKYPVVIFLHGIGERGVNSTDSATLATTIWNVAKNALPRHIKNGKQFPFICLSPQLKSNFGTWPSWYVMEVLNEAKTYLKIDEKRIYVVGLSMGGGGTWVAIQDQPKVFAAAAPVCGAYNSLSKACGIAAENLPVWAFHGDADSTVPFSRSVNMVNAINACVPTPNPKAIMTIYPGINHNSWDRAFALDNTYHTPNLYQWLLSYTNKINAGNQIPTANAGADRDVAVFSATGVTKVTKQASAFDNDGTIVKYEWTQTAGPTKAVISAPTAVYSEFSNLGVGTYVFRFQVTDDKGNTDSDYFSVKVALLSNALPIANAGPDVTTTIGSEVTLIGSGTDADSTDTITKYSWVKISGPSATMVNATSKDLTVKDLNAAGTYVFSLRVWDSKNASCLATDKVSIIVK
jgi:predicted esterase